MAETTSSRSIAPSSLASYFSPHVRHDVRASGLTVLRGDPDLDRRNGTAEGNLKSCRCTIGVREHTVVFVQEPGSLRCGR